MTPMCSLATKQNIKIKLFTVHSVESKRNQNSRIFHGHLMQLFQDLAFKSLVKNAKAKHEKQLNLNFIKKPCIFSLYWMTLEGGLTIFFKQLGLQLR